LSTKQLLALLWLESCIVLILGMGAGTIVGYGLAWVMRPFLSLTMASSLGGQAIDRLVFEPATLATAYVLQLGVYVISLLCLLGVLAQSRVHRTLRLGDD
jgi:hypothetical protein